MRDYQIIRPRHGIAFAATNGTINQGDHYVQNYALRYISVQL